MKVETTSFWEWQEYYSDNATCLEEIMKIRWSNGFQCPHCGHDHGWQLKTRPVIECAHCHKQTSITAGTLFHASKVSLVRWFWVIYWLSSDKGSISALRLSKLIGVSWRTAHKMLRKLRIAMGHQDSLYRLHGTIELDDAFIGGKRAGKRGRGAEGKTAIIVAAETKDGKPGFVALQVVSGINHETAKAFSKAHLAMDQTIHTDALNALTSLAESQHHIAKVTPAEEVDEWLPWVHIVVSNLKSFLLGTYHGISRKYVQEYLNEFTYRLNRRFWENEIPNRLLRVATNHLPIKIQPEYCS